MDGQIRTLDIAKLGDVVRRGSDSHGSRTAASKVKNRVAIGLHGVDIGVHALEVCQEKRVQVSRTCADIGNPVDTARILPPFIVDVHIGKGQLVVSVKDAVSDNVDTAERDSTVVDVLNRQTSVLGIFKRLVGQRICRVNLRVVEVVRLVHYKLLGVAAEESSDCAEPRRMSLLNRTSELEVSKIGGRLAEHAQGFADKGRVQEGRAVVEAEFLRSRIVDSASIGSAKEAYTRSCPKCERSNRFRIVQEQVNVALVSGIHAVHRAGQHLVTPQQDPAASVANIATHDITAVFIVLGKLVPNVCTWTTVARLRIPSDLDNLQVGVGVSQVVDGINTVLGKVRNGIVQTPLEHIERCEVLVRRVNAHHPFFTNVLLQIDVNDAEFGKQ